MNNNEKNLSVEELQKIKEGSFIGYAIGYRIGSDAYTMTHYTRHRRNRWIQSHRHKK
jgi:hypothetical protein